MKTRGIFWGSLVDFNRCLRVLFLHCIYFCVIKKPEIKGRKLL